jgi:hypothetical protein
VRAGFYRDTDKVRVGRDGRIRGPNNKPLTAKDNKPLYVSENPFVGKDGIVYQPDGNPILDKTTRQPLVALVDNNNLPKLDKEGVILGKNGSPLRDSAGKPLVLGIGPTVVSRAIIMLPVGRPLTDKDSIVLRAGLTADKKPRVDRDNCLLDKNGNNVKGKDGRPVFLSPDDIQPVSDCEDLDEIILFNIEMLEDSDDEEISVDIGDAAPLMAGLGPNAAPAGKLPRRYKGRPGVPRVSKTGILKGLDDKPVRGKNAGPLKVLVKQAPNTAARLLDPTTLTDVKGAEPNENKMVTRRRSF